VLLYNSWGPEFADNGVAKVSFASTALFECYAPMLGLYNGAAEAEAEAANVFPIAGAARFFAAASLSFAGHVSGAFQDQYREQLTSLAASTGSVQLAGLPDVPVQSRAQLYDLSVYSEVEPERALPRLTTLDTNAAVPYEQKRSYPPGYWAMMSSDVPGARIRTYLVEKSLGADYAPRDGGYKAHPQQSEWLLVPGMPRVLLNSVSVTLAHFEGDEGVLGGVTVEVILWPSTEAPVGSVRPRAVRLPAVGCAADRSTTKPFLARSGTSSTMALCSFDLPVAVGDGGSRDAGEEPGSVADWQSKVLPADEIGHVEVRIAGLPPSAEVALYGVIVSYDSLTSTLFGTETTYPGFADQRSTLLPSFDSSFDTSLVGARATATNSEDGSGLSPTIIAVIAVAAVLLCCCAIAVVVAVAYGASRRRRSTTQLHSAHPGDHYHHQPRTSRGSRRASHKFAQRTM